MFNINKDATILFCEFLDAATRQGANDIELSEESILRIQKADILIIYDFVPHTQIYLTILTKGIAEDTIDFKMSFVVLDRRREPEEYNMIAIYPQAYWQSEEDLPEYSATIKNYSIDFFYPRIQRQHVIAAGQWLRHAKTKLNLINN